MVTRIVSFGTASSVEYTQGDADAARVGSSINAAIAACTEEPHFTDLFVALALVDSSPDSAEKNYKAV